MLSNFSTTYRWAFLGVLAISLLAFTVSQQDTIREQARNLIHSENQISNLETLLSTESDANAQLRQENTWLQQQNKMLQDSIVALGKTIGTLRHRLSQHEATIMGIQSELEQKKAQLQVLKAQLRDMKASGRVELLPTKIQETQKSIVITEQQVNTLEGMKVDETAQRLKMQEAIMNQEREMRHKKIVEDIVKNTKVSYKSIECLKTRTSAPLRKMEEDGSDWVYTVVHFDLLNPNNMLLVDEYFEMKIVNTDTGEALSYLENNPAFANTPNDTKGFNFQWHKNPMEIVYINMQAKLGENYDLKMYYRDEEKEYFIPNSTRPLFRNGKVYVQ